METSEATGPETAPPPLPPAVDTTPLRKNAIVAGLLSGFPGVGNIYNGLYLRGATFFIIVALLIYLTDQTDNGLWGFAVAFAWIFNILDAYRQANLINYGYASDLGISDQPQTVSPGRGGLIFGIVLVVLGAVAFVEIHFTVDIDWLLDLWPVAVVFLGAWFIWSALKETRKPTALDSEA